MKIRCELCPTECVLSNYEIGGCKVRINKDGVPYSLRYLWNLDGTNGLFLKNYVIRQAFQRMPGRMQCFIGSQ